MSFCLPGVSQDLNQEVVKYLRFIDQYQFYNPILPQTAITSNVKLLSLSNETNDYNKRKESRKDYNNQLKMWRDFRLYFKRRFYGAEKNEEKETEETEEKIETLWKLLSSINAVISGSFVLQCLRNEIYKDSDLDIYVPSFTKNSKRSIKKALNDIEYNQTDNNNNSQNNFTTYEDVGRGIEEVKTFTKQGQKIQFIFVTCDEIQDYIVEHFDYEILKNTYDCQTEEFSLHCIREVIQGKTNFRLLDSVRNAVIRYHKYTSRGIHVVLPSCLRTYLDSVKDFHDVEYPNPWLQFPVFVSLKKLIDNNLVYYIVPEELRREFGINYKNKICDDIVTQEQLIEEEKEIGPIDCYRKLVELIDPRTKYYRFNQATFHIKSDLFLKLFFKLE